MQTLTKSEIEKILSEPDKGATEVGGSRGAQTPAGGSPLPKDPAAGEGQWRSAAEKILGGGLTERQAYVTVSVNKSMIRIKSHTRVVPCSGSIRGIVTDMSRDSRKRMFDWLNTIDWDKAGMPLFVTLTYGQSFPTFRESKRHLKALVRSMGQSIGAVWRVEPQQRGAPHFHLLLFGVQYYPKEQLKAEWGRIIGRRYWDYSREQAEEPFTRIERIRTLHGVRFYVGKYIAKNKTVTEIAAGGPAVHSSEGAQDDGGAPLGLTLPHKRTEKDQTTGRMWGVMNRRAVPRDRLTRVMTLRYDDQIHQACNWIKAGRGLHHGAGMGVSVYVDDDQMTETLEGIMTLIENTTAAVQEEYPLSNGAPQ